MANAEPKAELKIKPNTNPKTEPKTNPKLSPRLSLTEPNTNPKTEPKTNPKSEINLSPKLNPMYITKLKSDQSPLLTVLLCNSIWKYPVPFVRSEFSRVPFVFPFLIL